MTFALGVLPVVLLLIGFPIYVVLLAAVSVALVFYMHVPLAALHQNLFGAIDAFALLAVPFFIYAGEIMLRGPVARRMVALLPAGGRRLPAAPVCRWRPSGPTHRGADRCLRRLVRAAPRLRARP